MNKETPLIVDQRRARGNCGRLFGMVRASRYLASWPSLSRWRLCIHGVAAVVSGSADGVRGGKFTVMTTKEFAKWNDSRRYMYSLRRKMAEQKRALPSKEVGILHERYGR